MVVTLVGPIPRTPVESRVNSNLAVSLSVYPLSLIGHGLVNMLTRQRIVWCIVFYAVRALSNESRRLILSRTPC